MGPSIISECAWQDVKVVFRPPLRPCVYICFECVSLCVNSPHTNSLQGWAFSILSCFSFLSPPPVALACIRTINAGTDSYENSVQLPVVSIVCLIHSISPRLFLHPRCGEMGQFSLSTPDFIWLSSGAASVFACTVFQQTSFIICF